MKEEAKKITTKVKKPYTKPKVIHETSLEVRAGTPEGGFDPYSDIPAYMREE
jgi:hypothetical protein